MMRAETTETHEVVMDSNLAVLQLCPAPSRVSQILYQYDPEEVWENAMVR